jgi:hypothetical protein
MEKANDPDRQIPEQESLERICGPAFEIPSMFGPEYTPNGTVVVANRPHITRMGREFFAEVTMRDGLIEKVK